MEATYNDASSMFHSPALWCPPPTIPTATEWFRDDSNCGFTPLAFTAFPAVLSLSDLVIDNKIFEDLPEILEDSLFSNEVENQKIVVSSPSPSTPPALASKPSSMSLSKLGAQNTPLRVALPVDAFSGDTRKVSQGNSKAQQPNCSILPEMKEGPPSRRRGGRGKATTLLAEARLLPSATSSCTNALEAIPMCQQVLQIQAPGTSAIPKLFPLNVTTQNLNSVVAVQRKGNQPKAPTVYQTDSQPQKRSRRDLSVCTKRTQMTRKFDKVEHIVRERWRRDDMAGKYLTLESLLPPGSKRDRNTIVEESMELVKSLQHRKEELIKKRAELKLAIASAGQTPRLKVIQNSGSLEHIKHFQATVETGSLLSSSMDLPSNPDSDTRPCEAGIQALEPSECMNVPEELRNCMERFQVQSEHFHNKIVIDLICQPIPNFHSTLLNALECFGLEVTSCSVTKTTLKLVCNIIVKPFPLPAHLRRSTTKIVAALKAGFKPC